MRCWSISATLREPAVASSRADIASQHDDLAHDWNGSRTVLATTSRTRQVTLQFRTKSLRCESASSCQQLPSLDGPSKSCYSKDITVKLQSPSSSKRRTQLLVCRCRSPTVGAVVHPPSKPLAQCAMSMAAVGAEPNTPARTPRTCSSGFTRSEILLDLVNTLGASLRLRPHSCRGCCAAEILCRGVVVLSDGGPRPERPRSVALSGSV